MNFIVGKDKVVVSLLQFADDTLFFSFGDDEKFANLLIVLDSFSLALGLKVNKLKVWCWV